MKREISAGGIVVTKTPNGWYVLLMQDMKGRWTFPKGIIEKSESSVDAAKREVGEEVGVSEGLVLLKTLTPIEYFYYRKDTIKKTVYYFLFESPTRAKVTTQKTEGIKVARWMTIEEAQTIVDYKDTNIPLLAETKSALASLDKPHGHTKSS